MFLVFAAADPRTVTAFLHDWRTTHPAWSEAWRAPCSVSFVNDGSAVAHVPQLAMSAAGTVRLRRIARRNAATPFDHLGPAFDAARNHAVQDLDGCFSFAVLDRNAGSILAFRDHCGLAALYWAEKHDGILISDSLKVFERNAGFEHHTIAEFIATGRIGVRSTIWHGVQQVPPACALGWQDGRHRVERFFEWTSGVVGSSMASDEAANECRRLMFDAVDAEMDQGSSTWADLSGGHDSSSVASIAGALSRQRSCRRLGGTVTFVDSLGEGDETAFAKTVVDQYQLDWIRVQNPWPWQEDGLPPPETDSPTRDYPYWARDRVVMRELAARGGTNVMSGAGPDYYLPLTATHALDRASKFRFAEAAAIIHEWTVQNRTTFSHVVPRELLLPLLPTCVQSAVLRRRLKIPRWIRQDFSARRTFIDAQVARDVIHGWPGSLSVERAGQRLSELGSALEGWRKTAGLEVRHPLLSVPLVQFCLALDHRLRTNYRRPKPVLRFAMRGIVPATVLERVTKGSLVLPRVHWALNFERQRIAAMARNSVLADLGVIEPRRLLTAVDACASGLNTARHVYFALSLETWLSVKAGRGDAFATAVEVPPFRKEVTHAEEECDSRTVEDPETPLLEAGNSRAGFCC